MYIGHGRLCVCLCVCLSLATFPHYCTDPDVTWGMVGCPLVVQHWADLQLVHGFRYYDDIPPNAKCQRGLVLALYLVNELGLPTIYFYRNNATRVYQSVQPVRHFNGVLQFRLVSTAYVYRTFRESNASHIAYIRSSYVSRLKTR